MKLTWMDGIVMNRLRLEIWNSYLAECLLDIRIQTKYVLLRIKMKPWKGGTWTLLSARVVHGGLMTSACDL